jgi:hypothetical protein
MLQHTDEILVVVVVVVVVVVDSKLFGSAPLYLHDWTHAYKEGLLVLARIELIFLTNVSTHIPSLSYLRQLYYRQLSSYIYPGCWTRGGSRNFEHTGYSYCQPSHTTPRNCGHVGTPPGWLHYSYQIRHGHVQRPR